MLNARQCRRLVDQHILEFGGHDLFPRSLDSISGEVEMYGTSRSADGTCGFARPFTFKGKSYYKNWAIAEVIISQLMKSYLLQSLFNIIIQSLKCPK